ncbi:MAG: IS630 family transposase [Terriglobia bacterium]
MVQRAQTILLAADGLPWKDIRAQTGLSVTNSLKWVRRFRAERLQGLKDRPRPGGPPKYSPVQKVSVTALATSKPPEGCNVWTQRHLAEVTGMSKSTVNRILTEGKIKPHKIQYWCGRSPDPEFEAKQAEIVGLYIDSPDNALVLSVDEKSQIQALDRTQPELPLGPDRPRRQTRTYTRHGTVSLLAALTVHEGHVDARCVQRHTHAEFLAFLKHLYRKYPYKQLHLICDNLSAHKHAAVREWVSKRRRLTLHFTPTYASWLNQVEIWFSIFSRHVIKGGVWRSKQELVQQIMAYIDHYNQARAKPFKWTYTGKPLAA